MQLKSPSGSLKVIGVVPFDGTHMISY